MTATADEQCLPDGLDSELWYLQHSLDFAFQHQQHQPEPVELFEPTSSHHQYHLAASYLPSQPPPPPPPPHPVEAFDGCGLLLPAEANAIAADETKPQPTLLQLSSPSEESTTSESSRATSGNDAGRSTGRSRAGCEPPPSPPAAKAKTPQMVAKRNARERRRVEAVNSAFAKLRRYIPYEKRNKRLSKVKTLRITIDYIRLLQVVLDEIKAGIDVERSPNYHNLKLQAHRKEVGALASANY